MSPLHFRSAATGRMPRRLWSVLAVLTLAVALAGCGRFYRPEGGGYALSPVARTGAAAVVVGDSIYVVGGQTLDEMGADGGSFLRSVVRGRIAADGSVGTWEEQPPLDFPRGYASLAATDDSLYLVGGYKDNNPGTSGAVPGILRASIQPDGSLSAWTTVLEEFSHARGGAAVANNTLFILGGFTGNASNSDKILRISMSPRGALGSAIIAGNLMYPRNRFATVMSPHGIYVLGGYMGKFPNSYDNSVERLTWSEGGPQVISRIESRMPVKRGSHAAVMVGNHIVVAGGFDGYHYLDRIDVGDIDDTGEITGWRQAGKLSRARADLALAVHGGQLYVIGGGNGAGLTPAVERIDLSTLGVL